MEYATTNSGKIADTGVHHQLQVYSLLIINFRRSSHVNHPKRNLVRLLSTFGGLCLKATLHDREEGKLRKGPRPKIRREWDGNLDRRLCAN